MGKFKIPSTPSTTNKTIRFPNDVIEDVENAIKGKECTFSAFVIAAVKAALEENTVKRLMHVRCINRFLHNLLQFHNGDAHFTFPEGAQTKRLDIGVTF